MQNNFKLRHFMPYLQGALTALGFLIFLWLLSMPKTAFIYQVF
jgi:hypothetical protein